VRGGDRRAPVEAELADGVVEHLRPDHPDVEDARARLGDAVNERLLHGRGGEAHVAPDCDRGRLELLGVGTPDRVGALLVELAGVDAPDVVCLEDLGV
jgi:hypothetical protein